jgi:hypothetical protein
MRGESKLISEGNKKRKFKTKLAHKVYIGTYSSAKILELITHYGGTIVMIVFEEVDETHYKEESGECLESNNELYIYIYT